VARVGPRGDHERTPVVARGALHDPSVAPNFYWVSSRPAGPEVALPAPAHVSVTEVLQVQTIRP